MAADLCQIFRLMNDSSHTDPLTGKPLADATPAATVIIFRERDAGPPELLMVERSAKMAFAGGAAVFPGGRIDPEDFEMADALLADWVGRADGEGGSIDDRDELAARLAAIRETIEETGLAIGLADHPPHQEVIAARDALHGGSSLAEVCAEHGWRVDPAAFTPFTRWRPPFNEVRIFDTRFYIALCARGDAPVEVDATENRKLFWAAAQQVLDDADAGRLKIIFPTRRNLERLAQLGSFEEARAHAQAHPVKLIMPFVEERDGAPHLCIPYGLGYPVTSEPLQRAMRG